MAMPRHARKHACIYRGVAVSIHMVHQTEPQVARIEYRVVCGELENRRWGPSKTASHVHMLKVAHNVTCRAKTYACAVLC
jgi:hypothetical protein